MKGFEVKDGKKIQIMLEGEEKMVITAMDDRDLHQIGFLNFNINDRGRVYLSSIRVTDIEFLRAGVGYVMLNCFENYCANRYVSAVDGRFFPNGDGGIFAREFYEQNGYEIYRDGYEQYITKSLSKSNVDERFLVSVEREETVDENFEQAFFAQTPTDFEMAQSL